MKVNNLSNRKFRACYKVGGQIIIIIIVASLTMEIMKFRRKVENKSRGVSDNRDGFLYHGNNKLDS